MSATIDALRVEGVDALALSNDRVRAVVLPSLGGRVWSLEDRSRGRQWIWQRPGVKPVMPGPDAVYDDVWAGGWEELFPNDATGLFEGRHLPDHGEWWQTPWSVAEQEAGARARLRLTAELTRRRVACSKEFSLDAESDTLRVHYRIESRETEPFHFLFKQHLPIAVTEGCRLAVPGGWVEAVDPSFGTWLASSQRFPWPSVPARQGGVVDLRRVPPASSRSREFVDMGGLPDGWCGVDDAAAQASLRMHFDKVQLPFLWFFLAYGGWRDCYTAVLEPCTNLPKDLTEAVRRNQAARLEPGGVFETVVAVRLSGNMGAG